ncbi:estradiol 17-beta-dehydrogenase 2 [Xenopus laevis]|uniref:Estradiol 17-beta-dehydrogenase 2 n=2 Tax=Xenopus laevis TaxID=8355 RepID=A0A1L8GL07_XENLA|nr:estradiol 17-beta-dehydrogenase 2 [Xenopus laevis]OCT84509.1 hypothetical protein XELAEV_18022662mg [Xenopus laevis]
MAQLDSRLLYLAVGVFFSGSALHKLMKNKVKIENASVPGLLSLLILGIFCFFILSDSFGLTLLTLACTLYYYSIPVRNMLSAEGKSVLITGCDSGFGHALAKHLDELGVHVFAGVLDKKGPGAEELKRVCSSHLCLIQLNITHSEEIREAYKEISSHVQDAGLWGIVHNAGVLGYVADGELIPFSVYKQCMDVNFLGAVQVTKIFVPLLRKAKGRLVSISSMGGHVPLKGFAAYASSKAALSMFSAVMRQDLSKWGVKVAVVCPSGFRTNIFGSQEQWWCQNQVILDDVMPDVKGDYGEDYIENFKGLYHTMHKFGSSDLSPVLEDVCHALLAQTPNPSYTPGRFAYLIPCLYYYSPQWISDRISMQSFQTQNNMLPRALRTKNKT